MPLVSVVIPTFGRPKLVTRAVESVLRQTMSDLDVSVVIDGSDPATVAALEAIGDHRLRIIEHDSKKGAGPARDTGADASAGRWIGFLDDDDEWLPDKLEKQLAVAPDRLAVLMTQSLVVTTTGRFVQPERPYDGTFPVDEWLFGRQTWLRGNDNFLQTSSLLVPRELFDHVHFTDTKQHEEWELVIRACKEHGYALVTAKHPVVIYYRINPAPSLSNTYTCQQSLKWIQGLGTLITPRAYSGFCLGYIAKEARQNGDWSALKALLSEAFRGGRPTTKQLFAFALIWLLPSGLRRRIRAALQGTRAARPA